MSNATIMNFKQLDFEELDFDHMNFETVPKKVLTLGSILSILSKLMARMERHLTTPKHLQASVLRK
jgi:hypothetical protein